MAANIVLGSVSLASDGLTFTGTLSGGTGTGYSPALGLTNYSLTVGGVARQLQSSTISATTWTGIAYTPIKSGVTTTVVVATGNLVDSGANTASTGTVAVTNNSTATDATVQAALVNIPTGSLDIWRAARALHASQQVDIVTFGDSTTADSGAAYSWVYDTKHQSILAGFTNGGRGMGDGSGDTATRSGPDENLACFIAGTGFASSIDTFNFFYTSMFVSTAVNDTITFQGYGSEFRIYYTKHSNRGQFTYTVDGGAPVTVDTFSASGPNTDVERVSGLSNVTLHSVVVTNIGRPLSPPTIFSIGQSGPGQPSGFSSGTYYYVVTATNASGETTPSAQSSTTVPNGPRVMNVSISRLTGATGYKVYRSTVNGGPYQFISSIADSGGSFTTFNDDNTATPGANPPSSSTAGLNSATKNLTVLPEFVKSAGLVWHKNAISGTGHGSFGLSAGAYNNFPYQVSLGLTQVNNSTTPASRPLYRSPKLAIDALGINEQQAAQVYTSAFADEITKFITAAAAAGASPVVVIPHYSHSGSPTTAKGFIDGTKAACAAANVAWFDFNVVLDIAGFTGSGPHINQTGYNLEGDSIWTNLLATNASTPQLSAMALSGLSGLSGIFG